MSAVALLEKLEKELNTRLDKLEGTVKERDSQGAEYGELKTSLETRIQKQEGQVEEIRVELKEAVEELQKSMAAGNRPDLETREYRSFGELLTGSDEYKHYSEKQDFHGESPMFKTKGFFPTSATEMERKKTLNSTDGSYWGQMGFMITPDNLGIISQPQLEVTLRNRIPSFPTTSDTVTYMEELGWANVYTELNAGAAATATSITVKSGAGLFVGQEIQIGKTSNTEDRSTHTITAIDGTGLVLTITPAIPAGGRSANDPVTAVAIGMTAAGAQKPEASLLGVVERSMPIGTVAHYMTAHRQTLADAPQLQGIVNQRLLFGLAQSAELQLLYGNGASPNIQGILNNPSIQDHGVYDISNIEGGAATTPGTLAWRLDHFRRAVTKVQMSNYQPTDAMIHPNDWQEIELLKGSDQHYVWVTVPDGGVERLWRVPVNISPVIKPQQFMIGNLQQAAYILDREQANVRFSDQHMDYFTRNMVAILAEERLGLAVVRPQAIVKGSFTYQA